MTRRKSACSKWTIVSLVVFCQFVYSRPQDTSTSAVISDSTTSSVQTEKTSQIITRYKRNLSSVRLDIPAVLSNVNSSRNIHNANQNNVGTLSNFINNFRVRIVNETQPLRRHDNLKRSSRLISNRSITNNKNNINLGNRVKVYKNSNENDHKSNRNKSNTLHNNNIIFKARGKRNPTIRKVITKWTDSTKNEGLDFTYETSTSDENKQNNKITYGSSMELDYASIENNNYMSTEISNKLYQNSLYSYPNKGNNKNRYKPRPHHSEESQVYSSNVHIIDSYPFPSGKPYVFNTPKPTPIITNVGDPTPWSRPNFLTVNRKPTTQNPVQTKPLKNPYNYHDSAYNNYPQYPGNDLEVTTFQPSTAYTERIVIRPEEYNASSNDCPTIFLTLNNTFQGQAKEVCPDLNIAVNTNVINKNVVIETEEDDSENIFPNPFGIPLGENSENYEESEELGNDYLESEENEGESASVEVAHITNYNAANTIEPDSSQAGGLGSPSSPLSSISLPGRPGRPSGDDDDDFFGFTSLSQFFRPAFNTLGWFAAMNPFNVGIVSLLLAPLAFLFTGTSGLAALFAPWLTSYGREAPKEVYVNRPQWYWDDEIKTWQLRDHITDHGYEDKRWITRFPRSQEIDTTESSVKSTYFNKLKRWMIDVTSKLREMNTRKIFQRNRKNKRKKRETWTIRVK